MPKRKDHDLLVQLGSRFRELRQAHDMTQEEVAEALDLQAATVSRWERGKLGLSLPVLAQAADQFGVSLGELLALDRPTPKRELGHRKVLELWDELDVDQRDIVLRLLRALARR